MRRKSLGVLMGGVSLGPGCVTENLIVMTGQMKLTLSAQVRILSFWKESNFIQNRQRGLIYGFWPLTSIRGFIILNDFVETRAVSWRPRISLTFLTINHISTM